MHAIPWYNHPDLELVHMRSWITNLLYGAAGAGALTLLYARLIERTRVLLDHFTVTVDKPGLPPGGLTILHLSDFHLQEDGWAQARKLAALRRLLASEQYDLVALTGDLIHDQAGLTAALAVVAALRPRLGGFSCLGNHDYWGSSIWGIFSPQSQKTGPWHLADIMTAGRNLWAFAGKVVRNERVYAHTVAHDVRALCDGLQAQGVQSLVNTATHVQAPGMDFWVAGVDDLTQGTPDLAAALADVPSGAFLLLLAHNPDIWLEAAVTRADLVLAGHTHGGQVRLPGLGAIHTQGTHLPRRQAAGWFTRGTTRMFVTRGVGESLPLRLAVPPQAAMIHVIPRQEAI